MRPNDFWNRTDESRSWRFYVGLCELSSGFLDYATGLDLLRPGTTSEIPANTLTPGGLGQPGRNSRRNWASTCFYYSLVHIGRLLVFLPLGDFPKGHGQLVKGFTDAAALDRCPQTDWLKEIASQLGAPMDEQITVEAERVNLSRLQDFYFREIDSQETGNALRRFGRALTDAKKLRENNNYEALLIAHEFGQNRMTRAFQILADNMKDLAREFLALSARMLALYLSMSLERQWDLPAEGKVRFAKDFLERRVVKGINEWYGPEAAVAICRLIEPISRLDVSENGWLAGEIQGHAEIGIFSPKRRLMENFETGASNLRDLLEGAF